MTKGMLQNNLYEDLYRQSKIPISKQISKHDAANLIRHLGYIHNTFGIIMKDLIKVIGFKFEPVVEVLGRVSSKEVPEQIEPNYTKQCIDGSKGGRESLDQKNRSNNMNKCKEVKETKLKKLQKQQKIYEKTCPKEKTIPQSNLRGIQLDIQGGSNDKEDGLSVSSVKSQKQLLFQKEFNQQTKNCFTQLLRDQLGSKKNHSAAERPKKIQKMEIEFGSKNSKSKQITPIVIDQEQNLNSNIRKEKDVLPAPVQIPKLLQVPRNKRFEQRLSQFQYNYENSSSSVRFLPGRTKKEREQYPGIECKDCERYYKSMGLENPNICECSSRHRSSLPLRRFEKNNFTQQFDL